MSKSTKRLRQRGRQRGISVAGSILEAAAVMGWFVVLALGEKYMDDSVNTRRSAETAATQQAVHGATNFCGLGGLSGDALSDIKTTISAARQLASEISSLRSEIEALETGIPEMAKAAIPTIIMGLGISSLKTLALYSMPMQSSHAVSTGGEVTAARPLGYRSGKFKSERQLSCTEHSLDMPGAPWVTLQIARTGIYITNIASYL